MEVKIRESSQNAAEARTHLSLCASTFSPQCRSPFFLQAEFLEGFLDDASRCCEGEFDDKLGQMQVADGVLLARNAAQWTIDENLKHKRNVHISFIVTCSNFSSMH